MTCPELTTLQRVAGFIDLMSILQVGALVLAVVCGCYLIGRWLLRIIHLDVPFVVYEGAGYLIAVLLVLAGAFPTPVNPLWFTFGGCALFSGMLVVTSHVRQLKPNLTFFFSLLTLGWGAAALFYNSELLAFVAVACFLALLGQRVGIYPGIAFLGFEDNGAVKRGIGVGLLGVTIAILMKLVTMPAWLTLFYTGFVWLGTWTLFLALLIYSTKWFASRRSTVSYLTRQANTIICGVLALVIGSILDMGPLRGIGGTFFVIYLLEKPWEIPVEQKATYAFIGLGVAAAVAGLVMWAQAHMDIVKPYLLF